MSKYEDMNKEELMEEAQRLDIDGRSSMDKAELLAAVQAADGSDKPESDGDAAVDTEAAMVRGDGEGSDGGSTNGGFTVGGAGESGDESGLADIPKADGPKLIETDTDPVLDSEADYNKPEVTYVEDTNTIKSRREEEDDQHARREAGDAKIEALVEQAGRTPF